MSSEQDRYPRKVLGKGLSALLPSRPSPVPQPNLAATPTKAALPDDFEDFQSLALDQILPGSDQPRDTFDHERLVELAHSIKTNGLLQPITVQKHADGKYRIIAGERRWRAAKLAGLTQIAALVRTVEDSQRLELALIENIQREDLNPLEIAAAFDRLAVEHGMSHERIAERTGKDRSTVTNFLRLLRLGDEAKGALKSGHISMGHARTLLNLADEAAQAEACRTVIAKRLSVRDTEALVKRLTQEPKTPREKPEPKFDPNIRAALDEMAMALGTKVHLTPRRLEIEYYSPEDLERIYSVIVKQ
jgi:ParB family transcriptional regulator, chromosome partitioning protein